MWPDIHQYESNDRKGEDCFCTRWLLLRIAGIILEMAMGIFGSLYEQGNPAPWFRFRDGAKSSGKPVMRGTKKKKKYIETGVLRLELLGAHDTSSSAGPGPFPEAGFKMNAFS